MWPWEVGGQQPTPPLPKPPPLLSGQRRRNRTRIAIRLLLALLQLAVVFRRNRVPAFSASASSDRIPGVVILWHRAPAISADESLLSFLILAGATGIAVRKEHLGRPL